MATSTVMQKGIKDGDRLDKLYCRIDFSKTPASTGDFYPLVALPKGFVFRNICVNVVKKAATGNITLYTATVGGSQSAQTTDVAIGTEGPVLATAATGAQTIVLPDGEYLQAKFSAAQTSGIVDVIVSGDFMLGVQDVIEGTDGKDPWPDYLKE